MDNLRLWLLLVGLVFIAAVYGWGKFQERRAARRDGFDLVGGAPKPASAGFEAWDVMSMRAERRPVVDVELDELAIPVLDEVVAAAPGPVPLVTARVKAPVHPSAQPAAPAATPAQDALPREVIIVLGVTAPAGREFAGTDLGPAFHRAGLYFGDMNIFHAPVDLERPDGPALFSLANMVEPGTLEPQKLKLLSTPGLFLFTRLPGRVNGVETFDHLHATARFLARELRGDVCDERRQPLTPEKTTELRARIVSIIGDTVLVPEE